MKLFITIDTAKLSSMYNIAGYNDEKLKVDIIIKNLKINFDDIILKLDTFTDWAECDINKETDFILYHKTSTAEVVNSIKKNFKHFISGSHELGEHHDTAFKIIFNEEDNKADRIIEQIFDSVTTPDGTVITKKQAAEAFKLINRNIDLLEVMIETKEDEEQKDDISTKLKTNGEIVSFYLENYPKDRLAYDHIKDVKVKDVLINFKAVHNKLVLFFDI